MYQSSMEFLGEALADYFMKLAREPSAWLSLAIKCLCEKLANGHTCFDLEMSGEELPPADEWAEKLRGSGVVGIPGQIAPLILDSRNCLYFYRYHFYEQRLASLIFARSQITSDVDTVLIREILDDLFVSHEPLPNMQKVAAAIAASKHLCILTGGPGTGKTSALARIIVLLLRISATSLRIKLAAPTGKAARRMQESLCASLLQSDKFGILPAGIPDKAVTLHSLLGARMDGSGFIHDSEHPLDCDVLIIDEASMIDLALMYRVMDALPTSSRLILLGDRNQLASVEAGAVLGEIADEGGFDLEHCADILAMTGESLDPGFNPNPLSQCHIALSHNYRFKADSGIGELCRAVNAGEFDKVKAILDDPAYPDVAAMEWKGWHVLENIIQKNYKDYTDVILQGDVLSAFRAFSRFRVLCAHREGEVGVMGANAAIEEILFQSGQIAARSGFYAGRPIMILQNEASLHLLNGDIGITLKDREGMLRVCFEASDGAIRWLSPGRLPPHETAWSMTIHKSQGSEFDSVLMLLPAKMSPVMTRSLLYTGISRARNGFMLYGLKCLSDVIRNTPVRRSGIRRTFDLE